MRLFIKALAIALLSGVTLNAVAEGTSSSGKVSKLSIDGSSWKWNHKLAQVEDVPAEQTAVFKADGKTLTVGPWIAGKQDVRLVYQGSLPVRKGCIEGEFITDGLYPREGNVWIAFRKGNRTITETNYWLGVTGKWRRFRFPVLMPPADCDNIQLSFGFHMKTPGCFRVRNLRFGEPIDMDERKAPKITLGRASMPKRQTAAGKVALRNDGGTWWLVDADGMPFFSIGCAMYGNRMSPAETYPAFHDMGFNTVANGSNLKQWSDFNKQLTGSSQGVGSQGDRQPVFQFYRVNTEVGRKYDALVDNEGLHPGETHKPTVDVGGFNHAFPDPFDPRWEADARQQVREMAGEMKDKPYFMLWMAANERSHWNLYRYVWSPGCAREFDKFLRAKYATIGDLNKSWKTSFSSFEDLMEKKPEPLVIRGNKYEDFNAFSRIILKTFNEKILKIIHEEDPGRLVFSNRFMIHEVRGVFDNLDLYKDFDGIAVNIYPSNEQWGLDDGERQYLTLLHEKTGKPLMICEWSVPARDSHLYDDAHHLDWSYPQLMDTQGQRAQQAAHVMADFWNMPFVVGAHWFSWGDFNSRSRKSNRGLFTSDGKPWTDVQEALKGINLKIQPHNAPAGQTLTKK